MFSFANKVVEPAKYLIIAGIAYTLASTAVYFFADPVAQPHQGANSAAPDPSSRRSVDIDRITAQHLFGETSGQQVAATPQIYDAPETRLRLTLEGVFQADNPDNSVAIVAQQSRPGEIYLVGDRLGGDAMLAEVHQDRIILRRGSLFETLRFSDAPARPAGRQEPDTLPAIDDEPMPDYDQPMDAGMDASDPDYMPQDLPAESATGAPESREQAVRETVQQYRERLAEDPQGTLSDIGVAPIAEDSAEGYRLGALAQHPALRQSGLQSGDVILSVNGRPVGNVQQDSQQIDSVMAEGSVRLEVQRGGRRFFITTAL